MRRSTRRVAPWARQHPVLALLCWFTLVGQPIAFCPVVAQTYGAELPVAPFVAASNLFGLLLPTVVLTWLAEGRAGVRRLAAAAFRWRLPAAWFVSAVLVVPALALLVAMVLLGAPTDRSASTLATAVVTGLLVQTLLGVATSNLAEEVAWTGLVQARLQVSYGPLRAALVTGPLFALQHASLAAGNSLTSAVLLLAVLAVLAVPFRALLGWAYNRTGSLLLVGVAHAAGNAVAGGAGIGEGFLPLLYPGRSLGPLHIFVFFVLGLVVLASTRGRLGRVTVRPAGTKVPSAVATGPYRGPGA